MLSLRQILKVLRREMLDLLLCDSLQCLQLKGMAPYISLVPLQFLLRLRSEYLSGFEGIR
jgi:hypothetical protein